MNPRFLRRLGACLVLGAAACAAFAHDYTVGTLHVGHPWTRATVAGQPTGGGFLTLHNAGSTTERLVGASTAVADHVEMHSMSMDGDVMKMREVPAIEIPPGQTVALEPGKFHLMLVGLKAPLAAGTMVPLTLKFEHAGPVQVQLKVEAAGAAAPASGMAGMDHAH